MVEYVVHYCENGRWNMELRDMKYSYPVWEESGVTFSECYDVDLVIKVILKYFNPKKFEICDDNTVKFVC